MLGHVKEGTEDVREASKQKMTEEHDVINEALDERCARYTVFSIVCPFHYFILHDVHHVMSALWCRIPSSGKQGQKLED